MTSRRLIEATCPECRGPLTEIQEDSIVEYQCLVGHRYSPEALLHAHSATQERMLWSAVVALEEAKNLVSNVAPHLPGEIRPSLQSQADQKVHQAERIRQVLSELSPFRTG
jgi:two-component system, chemotaxis family, protein-glutamate methylesterase/glutaminase